LNSVVLYETRGPVAWITINRAEARNALSTEVVLGLIDALHRVAQDPDARVAVLTGAGDRAFCAGGDLKAGQKTFVFDYAHPSSDVARLFQLATRVPKPLIARVNGHVMAGGMGLLAMCDLAIAVDSALFGLPEVKIGMFPMQVDALLQRLIPRRKLVEMSLTGEPLTAQEAVAIGLVNHTCPAEQLDAKLDWFLARLLDKAPTAIRLGKHALETIADMTLPQAMEYMADQLGKIALTEDGREGLRAFNEKRAPVWTGR
jgi:methylglutaconyl-CoA hydratase